VPGALQASNDGLRCAPPGRDIGLGQIGQTSDDHFANDSEDGAEAVILGLVSGAVSSRARSSQARSIPTGGGATDLGLS
jgi:hypothetical protein